MSKFLGFLLGIAVALVGPAMFGVLAADGGIKLNAKEMALAYGISALIFWTVASYFSGAAALGAALTFGAMIYTVHWIPNRLTNFLNDVPGVTTGMIDGIKQYTLNGVVPILAVISLFFGIQSIVRSVQRRRRERVEADRLQREQEAAVQAQQMPEPPAAAYPVAAGDYPPDNRFGSNFGNNNYDDLFEEEQAPTPFTPRNQADEQTAQFAPSTAAMAYSDEERDETRENEHERADETVLVPTDSDETVLVPTDEKTVADDTDPDETVVATASESAHEGAAEESQDAGTQVGAQQTAAQEGDQAQGVAEDDATQYVPVGETASESAQSAGRQSEAESAGDQEDVGEATQPVPVPEPEAPKHVAPRVAGGQQTAAVPVAAAGVSSGAAAEANDGGEATQAMPIARPETATPAPQAPAPQSQPPKTSAPQTPAPQAPGQGAGTPSAASRVEDGGEATQAVPVSRPEAAAYAAPQAPVQQGVAPELFDQEAPGAEVPAPWVSARRGGGAAGVAPGVDDGGEATQAVPVTRPAVAPVAHPEAVPVSRPEAAAPVAPVAPTAHTPQAGLHRKEEMGQQYRERMDPPDVDDTGEFFVGAFEAPPEQPSPRMELPGGFRPTGR